MPQNRADIKAAARECLRGRLFRSFAVCLIPMLLSFAMMFFPEMPDALYILMLEDAQSGMVFALTLSPTLACLGLLLNALVVGPMTVRQARYFLMLNRNAETAPSPLSVCDCFGPGYGRLVLGTLPSTLIMVLAQYLPMLLALLPGLSEAVDIGGRLMYRSFVPEWVPLVIAVVGLYGTLRLLTVPYLLAEDSQMGAGDALRQGLAMTRGRAWELFVLQLSFFGWMLLVGITSGLAIVYMMPYYSATMAGFYLAFTAWRPAPDAALEAQDDAN